ncbi:MAG: 50S ribosomal protein L13 [Methanomicrobiales archaeon]|nr:50S ribosomal protein L13 [Methanomicrobiales archaeon]
MVTVIDADGLILGRLASIVAKRTLDGEEIAIVNAEKTVISGSRVTTLVHYDTKVKRGSREGGPFFPRRPDHILKRTIRGMLPYKRQRGAEALKRVKVYVGIPREFAGQERETLEEAHVDRLSSPRFVTLGTLSTRLGAKF